MERKPVEASNGCLAVTCPVWGAAMCLLESITYLDGTSSWSGICAGYGAQVEGERPEDVGARA